MSSFEALDLPEKETWQYVKFINTGTGATLAAYTDLDSNVEFEGTQYSSIPEMQVTLPDNNGLLNEAECEIALPILAGFATNISSGLPHPETRVEVVEFIRGDGGATPSTVLRTFKGIITNAKRNARGLPGVVAIYAQPVKSRIQTITLGLPCMHHCINRLGDAACKVDMTGSPRKVNATVNTIDGRKVTIVAGPVPDGLGDRFYERGYLEFEGLQIMVRTWRDEVNGNKNEFFLARRPPLSWAGAQLVIFAGCDKTIETCRARYNNEENFNGAGFAMPAYHPNYEDGGEHQ